MDEITIPEQIVGMLRRLQKARALVTVIIPKDSGEYHSAVLEVDPDSARFILDELKPELGHERLSAARTCRVRAQLEGVLMTFTTQIFDIGSKDGIAFYEAALPTVLLYRQRRNHYRVRVAYGQIIPVTLTLPGDITRNAEMLDISASGLSVAVREDLPRLKLGDAIRCSFQLASGETFVNDLEVRYFEQDPQTQISRLGGRFALLQPRRRQQLERYVLALERAQIKKAQR